MTTAVDTCPGCASALRRSREMGGGPAECAWCGEFRSHAPEASAAKPLAPLQERPPVPVAHEYNARKDMAALARWAGYLEGRAMDLSYGRVAPLSASGEDELTPEQREALREADRARAVAGNARLAAMRSHGIDGVRFAAIVRYVYAERGKGLNAIDSCATATADRFERRGPVQECADPKHCARSKAPHKHPGEPLEFDAWRAADPVRTKYPSALARIAFGNTLMDQATQAYERDAWPAPTVVKRSKRDEFAARVAAAWARFKNRQT